jgi:outer membrane protein assembly factor BamA
MPRSLLCRFSRGKLKTAVVSFLVSLLLLPTDVAAQQGAIAGLKVLPENLVFVGNKSFPSEDLRAIFRSAGTMTAQVPPQFIDTYNNDRIAHAINMLLVFYRNRGFVKASINPPEVDFGPGASTGKMLLVLRISEDHAYQLGQIRIVGAATLREEVVISMLNLQPRSPVNVSKINAGVLAVRETYLTLGYLDVEIQTSLDTPEGKSVADLKINIVEGSQYHVGKLELVGSLPVQEKLLREMLPFQAGDIFGRKAFDACLEALNELGITPVLTANDVDFNYDKPKALVDVAIHLAGKKK